MLLIGKPSISMGHLYHGYVSHNHRVFISPTHVVGISQQSSLPPKPPAIIVCQPVQKEKHTVTTKPLMLVIQIIQVHHPIKTRTLTQSNAVPFSLVLGCYFCSTSTGIYLIVALLRTEPFLPIYQSTPSSLAKYASSSLVRNNMYHYYPLVI